ncbi:MAG: amidohydrolase family protein, partial [Vulcanimicrobiaceae bacterium]
MIDFAVLDATQLLVVGEGKSGPRRGAEQGTIEIVEGGGLVASEGRIVEAGPSDALRKKHDLSRAKVLDAKNRVVMPGLVDPHTHPVFAGLRYEEYALLLSGASKE